MGSITSEQGPCQNGLVGTSVRMFFLDITICSNILNCRVKQQLRSGEEVHVQGDQWPSFYTQA